MIARPAHPRGPSVEMDNVRRQLHVGKCRANQYVIQHLAIPLMHIAVTFLRWDACHLRCMLKDTIEVVEDGGTNRDLVEVACQDHIGVRVRIQDIADKILQE